VKFKEYLNNCSIDRIKELNLYWNCCTENGELVRRFYAEEIFLSLIKYKKFIDSFTGNFDKEKLSDEQRDYLRKIILGAQEQYKSQQVELNKIGLMYGDAVFDEFELIIIEDIRKSVVVFKEEKVTVNSTPFMNLTLIINYLVNGDISNIEDILNRVNLKKNDKVRDKIKGYLNYEKFYTKNNNLIKVDYDKVTHWLKKRYVSISEFYKYLFNELGNNNIWKFLKNSTKIIQKSDEGIDVNRLHWFIEFFKTEIDLLESLGLIVKNKEKNLIKLSSECWYLATGLEPSCWSSKAFVVTPEFEVFMPFNASPFNIGIIDNFGEIKKGSDKKVVSYNNDYFVISNISKSKDGAQRIFEYDNFKDCLLSNCECIPDVVSELLF